jgi:hypothetical protein
VKEVVGFGKFERRHIEILSLELRRIQDAGGVSGT